MMLSDV